MATFPYTLRQSIAVTRIRTGVAAATTQSTNHYTITACHWLTQVKPWSPNTRSISGVLVHRRGTGHYANQWEDLEKFMDAFPHGLQQTAQSAGFEPARGDPNGFLVHRLNHSATTTRTDQLLLSLCATLLPDLLANIPAQSASGL